LDFVDSHRSERRLFIVEYFRVLHVQCVSVYYLSLSLYLDAVWHLRMVNKRIPIAKYTSLYDYRITMDYNLLNCKFSSLSISISHESTAQTIMPKKTAKHQYFVPCSALFA